MNLSEALEAALPEMPKTRLSRSRPPRLDPALVVREDMLDGEVTFGVLNREKGEFFRMTPQQWSLATLFDGVHAFERGKQLAAGGDAAASGPPRRGGIR